MQRKIFSKVMNEIRKEFFIDDQGMDIHEQACVAVVGASNKKSYFIKH